MGHLNQKLLARRWSISPRTLEAWRCRRQGPAHLKIGGRILYRIEDVEAYEASARRGGDRSVLDCSSVRSAS